MLFEDYSNSSLDTVRVNLDIILRPNITTRIETIATKKKMSDPSFMFQIIEALCGKNFSAEYDEFKSSHGPYEDTTLEHDEAGNVIPVNPGNWKNELQAMEEFFTEILYPAITEMEASQLKRVKVSEVPREALDALVSMANEQLSHQWNCHSMTWRASQNFSNLVKRGELKLIGNGAQIIFDVNPGLNEDDVTDLLKNISKHRTIQGKRSGLGEVKIVDGKFGNSKYTYKNRVEILSFEFKGY